MTTEAAEPRSRRLLVLVPLALFLGLATLFLMQLVSGRDEAKIPSALIGREVPKTSLPPLEGMAGTGIDSTDFIGKVTLVNVWASWCGPCRDEHPLLLELSRDPRFELVGLNYKDEPENARRFLGGFGNPYKAIGVDEVGTRGNRLGRLRRARNIYHRARRQDPVQACRAADRGILATTLMPEIDRALAAPPPGS